MFNILDQMISILLLCLIKIVEHKTNIQNTNTLKILLARISCHSYGYLLLLVDSNKKTLCSEYLFVYDDGSTFYTDIQIGYIKSLLVYISTGKFKYGNTCAVNLYEYIFLSHSRCFCICVTKMAIGFFYLFISLT